jgi:hypothetical protein
VVAAVLLVSAGTGAGGVAAADEPTPLGAAQLGDSGIDPDGVLLRVDLRTDGSARWTVEYRVRLNDENTTAAFESLRDDVESNESAYTTTFAERMRATARAAENTTGREMGVRNVSVRTARQQLPQEYGVVTYGFEWTGFAATTTDGLDAGDALAGLFLDRQTTLVVAWPGSYGTTAVDPAPDERRANAVVWTGPTDFGPGQPSVSLSTDATATGGTDAGGAGGDGAGGGDGATGGDGGAGSDAPTLVALGAVLVAALGAVAVLVRRRRGRGVDRTGTDAAGRASGGADAGGADEGSDAEGATTDDAEGTTTDDAEGATAAGAVAGRGQGDEDEDAAEDDGESPVDDAGGQAPWTDELLSNEERVVLLLEHNDGRMKQQAIAAELEWSDAKTSQVIGSMREAETVETFRLGRENVVTLPGNSLS